ncbi:MAG: hydroxypyruvate isomerase family protein [Butyricicoccaceae bacterium]
MKLLKGACIEPMYSELPFLERFAAAKKDGFDYVEFWSWTDKDLDAVKAAAENAGIGISGFNGDADYSLINPAEKEDYLAFLRQSVAAAQKVGAASVTIHSNALGDGGIVVNHYDELSDTVKLCAMFDTLKECAKIAEESGIQMNLEGLNITTDHVGNFLKNTQMAAEMTRIIGSPKLKILYDAYHMQLNEGSICDTIRTYIDQIGHIHIADAPGRHEPGTGEICYANVMRTLEELNYRGIVGCELFPKTTTAEAIPAIMSIF